MTELDARFDIGTVKSFGRTISAAEANLFSSLTAGDPAPNYVAAEGIAPIYTASMVASLAASGPLNKGLAQQGRVKTVAALTAEAQYLEPVEPGDTIWAESLVREARKSLRNPRRWILTIGDKGVNQRGDTVVVITRLLLVEGVE